MCVIALYSTINSNINKASSFLGNLPYEQRSILQILFLLLNFDLVTHSVEVGVGIMVAMKDSEYASCMFFQINLWTGFGHGWKKLLGRPQTPWSRDLCQLCSHFPNSTPCSNRCANVRIPYSFFSCCLNMENMRYPHNRLTILSEPLHPMHFLVQCKSICI